MKRFIHYLGKVLIKFCLLTMAGWAAVAIFYSNLPVLIRPWVAVIFAIGKCVGSCWQVQHQADTIGLFGSFCPSAGLVAALTAKQ